MTSAPPVNSLAESPSPANIAAVAAPKTTSVINKIPRRAGASRMAAHMRAAIERTHHKPPVKSTVIATANRSLVAIVEKGARNSALAREVKVAPKANRNAEGKGVTSDLSRIPTVANVQTRPPIKANHSPRFPETGNPSQQGRRRTGQQADPDRLGNLDESRHRLSAIERRSPELIRRPQNRLQGKMMTKRLIDLG